MIQAWIGPAREIYLANETEEHQGNTIKADTLGDFKP